MDRSIATGESRGFAGLGRGGVRGEFKVGEKRDRQADNSSGFFCLLDLIKHSTVLSLFVDPIKACIINSISMTTLYLHNSGSTVSLFRFLPVIETTSTVFIVVYTTAFSSDSLYLLIFFLLCILP